MRVNNTASELMSILSRKNENLDEDRDDTIAKGFSAFFAQSLRKSASPSHSVENTTSVPATSSSAPLSSYVNQSPEYKEFRNKIINETYELSDDMFSYDENGKYVNQKGYDYIYKRRVAAAKPLLPANIAEATEKYERSTGNIENYLNTLYEKYDVQAYTSMCNSDMVFPYRPWGFSIFENNKSEQNYFSMNCSDEGKEPLAMMEERNLYGAISTLASSNAAFAKEYDENPATAVDKYYKEIGANMASQENMPRIDTRKSIPYIPTVFNASKGPYNQTEFIPLS